MRNYFRFLVAMTVLLSISTTAMAQTAAFNLSRIDSTADACENFFQYANGNWVKNTQLPPAYSRWGSFNILRDSNQNILKEILETSAKTKSPSGSTAQLIGDYYASCMDEAAIEKAGTSPLKPYLKQIDKIKDMKGVQSQIA